MTDEIRRLERRRIAADVTTTLLGIVGVATFALLGTRASLIVGVYGLLLGTSTALVTYSLTQFTGITVSETETGEAAGRDPEAESKALHERAWKIFTGRALESDSDVEKDTGWLIGRLENVVVLTLVIAGQYTALSIIFAAKSWVRIEDTASENTTYYLAGTLVNFTYSIVFGVGLVQVLGGV
jgi:hypothetical protein